MARDHVRIEIGQRSCHHLARKVAQAVSLRSLQAKGDAGKLANCFTDNAKQSSTTSATAPFCQARKASRHGNSFCHFPLQRVLQNVFLSRRVEPAWRLDL